MYKHFVHREDSGRCVFEHEQISENSDGIVHKLIIEKNSIQVRTADDNNYHCMKNVQHFL